MARKAFKPVERVLSSTSEEDEPVVVKFLKMNCRYFTDGKVGGTRLLGIVWESLKAKSVWLSERWILGESNMLHFVKSVNVTVALSITAVFIGTVAICCIILFFQLLNL